MPEAALVRRSDGKKRSVSPGEKITEIASILKS